MRTRRSARTKSYAAEKYDFESSSDDAEGQDKGKQNAAPKRRKNDEERDENFHEASEGSPDAEELALEQGDIGSDGSRSQPEPHDRFSRQRIKPIKPFNVRAAEAASAGYLNIEPLTLETQLSRPYTGPFERHTRGQALLRAWYGADGWQLERAHRLLGRWMEWTVCPPKMRDLDFGMNSKGVWRPGFFDKERFNGKEWNRRVRRELPRSFQTKNLPKKDQHSYMQPQRTLPVLLGPIESQQTVIFSPGDAYSISQAGLPFDQDQNEAKTSTGWMIDSGGIVVSMDWAPRQPQQEEETQLLALAVIPHHDHELYDYETEAARPDFEKYGTVQLWAFRGGEKLEEQFRPSTEPPKLAKTLCFDSGRARRVKWSPFCENLAVLCGNGMVYVVAPGDAGNGSYERIEHPIASLEIVDEYSVKATAMAWININRLAVGYSDGSIGLWSINPQRLLSRHPLHHNDVVSIASGYPTKPYVIASNCFGGRTKIIDLQAPSYERTEASATAINVQPNLLVYSDHLMGFTTLYPSSKMLNTVIGFAHMSQFPQIRRLFTGDSYPTCLAAGHTHPFLLIGLADGSLWSMNPQNALFSKRYEITYRIRLLQHEHRPAEHFPADSSPAAARGVSRVLRGYRMEKNQQPLIARTPAKKNKKAKVAADDGEDDEEGPTSMADPSRAVVHEPLTRITVVEWNPNEGYGCWAAAAMGSGLVMVMDLGLEAPSSDDESS